MHLAKFRRGAIIATPLAVLLIQTDPALTQSADPQGPAATVTPGNHEAGHVFMVGGPVTFKFVTTYRLPSTTSSTAFIPLPNAIAAVVVAAGSSALINVRFNAETRCNEVGGAGEQNWCEVRILIGGVEGHPQASSFPPDTFALDSTDDGTETIASWEGHSLERHRCFRNPQTTPIVVPVVVEWKVTNFGGDADFPEFWVDDFSLAVERADGCQQAGG